MDTQSSRSSMIQIIAPHYTAGLMIFNGRVIEAAPIVRWMVGKSIDYVYSYCQRKGYRIEEYD